MILTLLAVSFVAAAQEPPARAKEMYGRAVTLDAQGNPSAALSLLWEAAGLAPKDADIQNRLGEALERIGALDAAVSAYRAAVQARPAFRTASNNLILALVKAGRGEEAVTRARAEVAAAPDDPDRHFTLGLAQSEPDVAGAERSFRRVLDLSPGHTLARYNLALVLKRSDRIAEAIAELERVIGRHPRAEAHYTLGVLYMHRGDLDRAAASLRAAIAAQPDYADAYYTLGALLHGRGEARAAAALLRRAIALRPDLTGAHDTLARVLQASGDAAAARQHFEQAQRLREAGRLEQEARMWTTAGTEKLEAGDVAAALDCFRRATGTFPDYAPAHFQTGVALLRAGDAAGARAAFERARQLNPALVPPRFF